jgi:branched-chain amino acid transport system permease protein
MMLLAIMVVIVGGQGSLPGLLVGSLYVGLVSQFGNAYFPELSQFSIYAPVVLLLALRPRGLFSRAGAT